MQIAAIAQILGLPEDRVAQIMQMVKMNGLSDSQMGPMMTGALARGITREQIMEVMESVGVPRSQVLRVMQANGIMGADEAAELEQAESRRAAQDARTARASRVNGKLASAGAIAFWLVVWEVADRLVDNRLVLAGPIRTLQALVQCMGQPDFLLICGASFVRIAAGFLLSFAIGLALAALCYRSRVARTFIDPLVSLLRTVPVISFVIMLLIWVGNQMLTVYLSFLIVLPLVYTNTLTGLESVDAQMLEMARVYRLGPWRTLMYIYRPALMPFITSSCRLSLGMSWKSGIMAEVIATPKPSIGRQMSNARTYLDTPTLFAWTVVVMVLSWAFEKAFMLLLDWLGRPLGQFLGKGGE